MTAFRGALYSVQLRHILGLPKYLDSVYMYSYK